MSITIKNKSIKKKFLGNPRVLPIAHWIVSSKKAGSTSILLATESLMLNMVPIAPWL